MRTNDKDPFLDCMASTSSMLNRIAETRDERMTSLARIVARKNIKRVKLIGSGSSYNSACIARKAFDDLGIDAECLFPNVFVNYTNSVDSNCLYVVISQGGSTRLVYEAAQKARESGAPVCSITADTASPIAQSSNARIEMGCGEEPFVYRTIGVSTTVASCHQVALAIGLANGTVDAIAAATDDERLAGCANRLGALIESALSWYEHHRFSLMRKHYLVFCGAGDLWGVAREAAIKAMEMVPMLTNAYELEEIIHGPQNCFDSNGAYFVFAREGEDKQKARNVASFLSEQIGFCSLVGNLGKGSRDFVFEEGSRAYAALEHLIFAQVLAYRLASDHGRDLKRKVNGSIANYMCKTL